MRRRRCEIQSRGSVRAWESDVNDKRGGCRVDDLTASVKNASFLSKDASIQRQASVKSEAIPSSFSGKESQPIKT